MKTPLRIILPAILGIVILSGCAAPLKIMTPAKEPLTRFRTLEIAAPKNDIVGKIDDGVVNDIMENAVDGILDMKHFDKLVVSESIGLKKDLSDKVSRPDSLVDSTGSSAVLRTTIVEYDEGSGILRFLFGVFAGSGKVTLELSVLNKTSQDEVLKARTTAQISGAFSSASNVVTPLSKAIVNFVRDNFVEEKK